MGFCRELLLSFSETDISFRLCQFLFFALDILLCLSLTIYVHFWTTKYPGADIYINNFNELKEFLDRHISESTDTNFIDVFPLRCGIGKTTYIKYAISDALRNGRGLIVITDSLKRMKEYTSDSVDNDLAEYVSHNLKRIAIL